jgi:hypothetical protein
VKAAPVIESEWIMSIHQFRLSITVALTFGSILVLASPAIAQPSEIALPSDRAYPESITAAPDGTL